MRSERWSRAGRSSWAPGPRCTRAWWWGSTAGGWKAQHGSGRESTVEVGAIEEYEGMMVGEHSSARRGKHGPVPGEGGSCKSCRHLSCLGCAITGHLPCPRMHLPCPRMHLPCPRMRHLGHHRATCWLPLACFLAFGLPTHPNPTTHSTRTCNPDLHPKPCLQGERPGGEPREAQEADQCAQQRLRGARGAHAAAHAGAGGRAGVSLGVVGVV